MAVRRNISQKDLLAEDKKPLADTPEENAPVSEEKAEHSEKNEKKKKEKTHILPVGDTDEYPENEDEHMIESNTFLDVVFDENFEYIIKNPVKKFFGCLLWMFGMTLLPIITFFMYGFKVKNKKYIRRIIKSGSGALTVSNHVHIMDCVMACQANWPKMSYLPTLHTTFQLPYVRHIVHLLNAFPIPNTTAGTKKFIEEMDGLLKRGKFVHFFPEGALWPWYNKIRTFKPGAFHFAVKNNVPVIPLAIKYRPRKLTKIFSKRPLVSIEVLPPVYPNTELPAKKSVYDLTQRVHDAIAQCVEFNNDKYFSPKIKKKRFWQRSNKESKVQK